MKKVIFVSLFSMLVLISCTIISHKLFLARETGTEPIDTENKLAKVLTRREIKVVLDYNTTNYFIYKGEPMGFQYELLKEFCDDKNLELKIVVSNDLSKSIQGLINNDYDIVAKNIISDYTSNQVDYTEPLVLTRLVLVQRQPDKSAKLTSDGSNEALVFNREGLKGKQIHVSKNSVLARYLTLLSEELGGGLTIVEDSVNGSEQLIYMVSNHEIDYTVCKEITSKSLKLHYSDVNFSTPLGLNQKFSWAISKNSLEWKEFIDKWIVNFKETSKYDEIYYKYFSGNPGSVFRNSEFNSFLGGKISVYDEMIKKISATYHWDWRLISSIILKESNFDPLAESGMGAIGLMQLMPNTAEIFNIGDLTEPSENIRGGVEYLTYLDEIFMPIIPDKNERLKFVLASYNGGVGHVMDARKLAMKFNRNPSVWNNNVDYFLLNKSMPQYYNDPIVKYGYCRGVESLNFVSVVLEYYLHYLNIIPPAKSNDIAVL